MILLCARDTKAGGDQGERRQARGGGMEAVDCDRVELMLKPHVSLRGYAPHCGQRRRQAKDCATRDDTSR